MCGKPYKPTIGHQRFCKECGVERTKEIKRRSYLKMHPNTKPKHKCEEVCAACGGLFSGWFDGKPYCNKHWLRLYTHGSLEPKVREKTCRYEIDGDVLRITTQNNNTILADAEDYEKLSKHSWCLMQGKYPVARIDGTNIKMSRYLFDNLTSKMFVDHINGNTLDNRKQNLRICTPQENSWNKGKTRGSTMPTGVRKTESGKFEARIMVNRKNMSLGTYGTLSEAVDARRKAEIKYFGEFAPCLSRK